MCPSQSRMFSQRRTTSTLGRSWLRNGHIGKIDIGVESYKNPAPFLQSKGPLFENTDVQWPQVLEDGGKLDEARGDDMLGYVWLVFSQLFFEGFSQLFGRDL
jgi:hypothetical protein